MPCACLLPAPNFPTNCEWGPILWRILHGLADKYGRLMSTLYLKEEEISWYNLINETLKILPCKECKTHYKEFLDLHNPKIIKTLPYDEQKVWVQQFFWELHNIVNLRNDKPSIEFDKVHDLYKAVNFQYELKHFEKLLKIVFQYNEVTLLSWQKWIKSFRMLTSIYGI